MSKILLVVTAAVLAASLHAGCRSQPKTGDRAVAPEPQWLSDPGAAFPDLAGKAFFGVGIAEAKEFPGLSVRRSNAIHRATDSAARQVDALIASVIKDYSAAAWTPGLSEADAEALINDARKVVEDAVLNAAEIYGTWTQPATDDFYAVVVITAEMAVKPLRARIIEIEKGRLAINAEDAHKQLDAIIERLIKQR